MVIFAGEDPADVHKGCAEAKDIKRKIIRMVQIIFVTVPKNSREPRSDRGSSVTAESFQRDFMEMTLWESRDHAKDC